ncbi:Stp1/IreP family PP2C-type Ser/Thr phosphatase [Azonexus sp.]|uniref:Stp1/IreP family PP2C-type Ser/Thr phosphatase n=1 Tax=Azonexus sp. TaxID=1872668 RepID=UPI0027B95C42|nr:Stp1/IreP family PP2C-type Ser/Thr phosphatase [Azonexus sp.]
MNLHDALEIALLSDTGVVRTRNEDAVFADAELGLAILADGMGGYKAGEVASGMATTLLATSFNRFLNAFRRGEEVLGDPVQRINDEICAANLAIFNAAQSQPQYAGMGTTLVFAWFIDNRMYLAHVGDSRVYRWRDGDLEQLTKDHSFLQEQIDSGMISVEAARYSANKNLVTRALGVDASVDVDIAEHATRRGDLLLFCSDGLNDMLEDGEIAGILHLYGTTPALAAEHLVDRANQNGGRDNVSVILIQVRGEYAVPSGWWQKLLARLK